MTMTPADEAVTYLLNRIQTDANMHFYCGYGTHSFELLCAAEAANTGKHVEAVKKARRKWMGSEDVHADVVIVKARLHDATNGEEGAPLPAKREPKPPHWYDCDGLGKWATNGHFMIAEGEPAEDRFDWYGRDLDIEALLHGLIPAHVAVVDEATKIHADNGDEVIGARLPDGSVAWFLCEYLDRFNGCELWSTEGALGPFACKRGGKLVGVIMPRSGP